MNKNEKENNQVTKLNGEFGICESCGEFKHLYYDFDPYQYEINHEIVYRNRCLDCYQEMKKDI